MDGAHFPAQHPVEDDTHWLGDDKEQYPGEGEKANAKAGFSKALKVASQKRDLEGGLF